MLKPLSPKTLEKKYAELGLPEANIELLHTYFRCFANLYGIISIRDAWEVFRHYEGTLVHKKDFIAFSGVVQREAGNPYSVYELKEIYSGENTDEPLERLIVNNRLVSSGYYKFADVYTIEDNKVSKPYYLPDRQVFLSFTEDRFYLTTCGQQMRTFVEHLISSGVCTGYVGLEDENLYDVDGNWVKGKKLSEFVGFTPLELFDIGYYKSNDTKQKLKEKYSIPAAEKVLNRIQRYIMVGGCWAVGGSVSEVQLLTDYLKMEFGVNLTLKQLKKFMELFMNLNNSSNLWTNCGWSPDELYWESSPGPLKAISVGPNMKRMFATGELDEKEFRRNLEAMNIELVEE